MQNEEQETQLLLL